MTFKKSVGHWTSCSALGTLWWWLSAAEGEKRPICCLCVTVAGHCSVFCSWNLRCNKTESQNHWVVGFEGTSQPHRLRLPTAHPTQPWASAGMGHPQLSAFLFHLLGISIIWTRKEAVTQDTQQARSLGGFHLGFLTYFEVIVAFLNVMKQECFNTCSNLGFSCTHVKMVEVGRELVEIIWSNPCWSCST